MRRTTVDPKKSRTDPAKNSKPIPQQGQGRTAQGYNQALKCFSCPLCLAPRSLLITLTVSLGKGTAMFQCSECKREGRTGAGSIQYPYKMSFAPKLQKKVDVFFKFRDYVAESGLQGAAAANGASSSSDGAQASSSSLQGGSLLGDALHNKRAGGDATAAAASSFSQHDAGHLPVDGDEGADDDDDDDDDLDGLFGGENNEDAAAETDGGAS